MLTKDKILGCYWGLALGDALGMPIEFKSIEDIRSNYGDDGIQNPRENAIWTDDTEMTIAVTNSLLRLGKVEQIKDLNEDIIGRLWNCYARSTIRDLVRKFFNTRVTFNRGNIS